MFIKTGGREKQEMKEDNQNSEYVVITAKENGVAIIGLTRGDETKSHHTEKLDEGEVLICQFTDKTGAIKVRGNATIHTRFGEIQSTSKTK